MIAPITVTLRAYGKPANLSKIRKEAEDLIKEEHDAVDPAWVEELEAKDIAEEMLTELWDSSHTLLKLSKTHGGIRILMPDMHERFTTEMLEEIKIAKTCVLLASWHSDRDGEDHQVYS